MKTIFSKIFALVLLSSLIAGTIVLVVLLRKQTASLETSLVQKNKLLAEVLADTVKASYLVNVLPFTTLERIATTENISFLRIADPYGGIYYADNPKDWGKRIEDPFLNTNQTKVRDSIYLRTGQAIKLIATPIKMEIKEKPWTLFLGVSTKQLNLAKRTTILQASALFVVFILVLALVAFYFFKSLTKPLDHLMKGVKEIGKGNLEHQVSLKEKGEFSQLAKTLNQTTRELKESRAGLEEQAQVLEIRVKARTIQLRELNKQLEARVKERTKELQDRIDELEKFHKLTVGREMKMIELKRQLKKAQQKIKQLKG